MTKTNIRNILAIISITYLSCCAYLYFFQRSILYLPDKELHAPAEYNLPQATALKLTTSDNIQLTAWYIAPRANMPILVYFHGNAANLGRRAKKFNNFAAKGFGLLAISYRGYGNSQGSPSEEGLYTDARTTINYLTQQGFKTEELVLYGESLGTGVAVQMALENNFRAVVLEAPYDSIGARAAELYPVFPVQLILKDKFESIAKISQIHSPILVFHSKDDMVMPVHHGIKLFEAAIQPKKLLLFENSGHSNFDSNQIAQIIIEYLAVNLR